MGGGGKKGGGRREPMFGLAASLSELRLRPQDRVTVADDKPKASKRKERDPGPPRERKRRGKNGGKRRSRGALYSLFYWGAVLGLWAGIALVGVVAWVGAH